MKLEIALDYFYVESHGTIFLQLLFELSSIRLAVFLRLVPQIIVANSGELTPGCIGINNRRN